jgi:hypothetical protein
VLHFATTHALRTAASTVAHHTEGWLCLLACGISGLLCYGGYILLAMGSF